MFPVSARKLHVAHAARACHAFYPSLGGQPVPVGLAKEAVVDLCVRVPAVTAAAVTRD